MNISPLRGEHIQMQSERQEQMEEKFFKSGREDMLIYLRKNLVALRQLSNFNDFLNNHGIAARDDRLIMQAFENKLDDSKFLTELMKFCEQISRNKVRTVQSRESRHQESIPAGVIRTPEDDVVKEIRVKVASQESVDEGRVHQVFAQRVSPLEKREQEDLKGRVSSSESQ